MAELFKILKMYRDVESPDIDGVSWNEISSSAWRRRNY